jgi:hypothetical protein
VKVSIGLYGEISKKQAVSKRSEHFLTGKSKYVVDHDVSDLSIDLAGFFIAEYLLGVTLLGSFANGAIESTARP